MVKARVVDINTALGCLRTTDLLMTLRGSKGYNLDMASVTRVTHFSTAP